LVCPPPRSLLAVLDDLEIAWDAMFAQRHAHQVDIGGVIFG
jgi:hypothetical protein